LEAPTPAPAPLQFLPHSIAKAAKLVAADSARVEAMAASEASFLRILLKNYTRWAAAGQWQ
jgi:hypothetical protein